ncbi:MAG: hypothetical protein J5762_07800 [Clostridia bacterium]|nr:hypothetical protein [Clostridia bacterium]
MENEQIKKYLKAAREAEISENYSDAEKYYDLARLEAPDCAEARFYYAYSRFMNCKNKDAYNYFMDIRTVIGSITKLIAESDIEQDEKNDLLGRMTISVIPLPKIINNILNRLNSGTQNAYFSQIKSVEKNGMATLYLFGDQIEKYFGNDKSLLEKTAVKLWKAGVELQQQWWGVGLDKSYPEKYTAKIQKFDPTYTMPKRGGCISFKQ